jgi:beta-lactamase superfamily II metal-dependent hydrolase
MHLLPRAFADRIKAALAAMLLVVGTVLPAAAQPLSWSSDDVYVRIVDVGAGLCTVTVAPGDKIMVYDAGRWDNSFCSDAVRELVPESGEIDLLVLSHSDADHIGEVETILAERPVRLILRTGHVRETVTWGNANQAIADAVARGTSVINLRTMPIEAGTTFSLGPAEVTFVAGWHEWPVPAGLSLSERRNVISIVVRLEFAGNAVLFTGDTVGHRIGDPPTACKDAEEVMVDNAETVPLNSAVIIAPHHGADNASARCFIEAVDPDYVIFSAGHAHRHPRQSTAERYHLGHGVPLDRMFRTDRGDHEGGAEWITGAIAGCRNRPGHDDLEIVLSADGEVAVGYRSEQTGC